MPKTNQFIAVVLIFCFITQSQSGPLAIGAWTACMNACAPLAAAGPLGLAAAIACWAACGPAGSLACFANDTTITTLTGTGFLSNTTIGDLVLTETPQGLKQWTKIKRLIINSSYHEFVTITTQMKSVTVTTDHVMISGQKLIKAQNLKVGMKLGNEIIVNVQFLKQKNRITVVTQSGTILANGILTTTICGDYIDVHGNNLEVLEKWKRDHKWLMVE